VNSIAELKAMALLRIGTVGRNYVIKRDVDALMDFSEGLKGQ